MRRAAIQILSSFPILIGTLAALSAAGMAQDVKHESSVLQKGRAVSGSSENVANGSHPINETQISTAAVNSQADQVATVGETEKRFEDWTLQCLPTGKSETPCQATHRLMSADKKQVVLVVSMGLSRKNVSRMQMALPLGFSIQHGVKITFGKSYATTVPISRCTFQGCLIEGIVPPEMISAMEQEKSGIVSVWTIDDAVVELPLSLSGFGDAYKAEERRVREAG